VFYTPHTFLFDLILSLICKVKELRTCNCLFFILVLLSVLFSHK
jgi:hypothetical protein